MRSTSTPSKRASTPVGGGGHPPRGQRGRVPPCRHKVGQVARVSSASCQRDAGDVETPVRKGAQADVQVEVSLQVMSLVQVRALPEGTVTLFVLLSLFSSRSLSPSPPPPTPPTRPARG